MANPVGMVDLHMDRGEFITAEAGSMVYVRGDIEVNTRTRTEGGLFKALKTTVLAGESFFINEYTARHDGCKIGLTGNALGDIIAMDVGPGWIVQSGAYVASTGGLTLDTQWQGFTRGLFGSNLFMLKTMGTGTMFVNAWGAIRSVELGSETMVLDNYQLVAMSPDVQYEVQKHGSFKTAIFGGEGLVTSLRGPGTVYYQTKNLGEFANTLAGHLPRRR